MPFKFHASLRHKFAKSKHRVTNWSEYTESLRQRADITVWVDERACRKLSRWAAFSRFGAPFRLR